MARSKTIRFYDIPLPLDLPEAQNWLHDYHHHSKVLADYMKAHGAGSSVCHSMNSCLTELRDYLLEKGIQYSPENAMYWCNENKARTRSYLITLFRLSDIFCNGSVQPANAYPRSVPYSEKLFAPWNNLLYEFMNTLEHTRSSSNSVRNCVARFLYRIQQDGITAPSDISFEFLESYCQTDGHRSNSSYVRYIYAIGDILLFMADKGLCPYGLGWYPYFRMHGQIFHIQDFTKSQIAFLQKIRLESQNFSAERFAGFIPDFLQNFRKAGYSKTPCKVAKFTLYNLLLFLEMNDLGYQKAIANVWLEHYKLAGGQGVWKQARRVLRLFDLYLQEGKFVLQPIFSEKELLCDSLPTWCKTELYEYLELKTRECWKKSTLDMIRASITRFCIYLIGRGLTDFSELNTDILKDFNLSDKHQTTYGKNAYNIKIRKFIKFLERKEILPYGIHQGLMATAAQKEKIVVVLTQEEKNLIDIKFKADNTFPIELRDKAIMMLGLKMGLRACDVVKIRLTDIDWNKQTLRVVQKKTGNELILPLPTEVGNSIYLYIKDARPNKRTTSDYLFVKNRIPCDSLSKSACTQALKRFLPDRKVYGSAFHVTRKTYATDRLKNGTKKQGIADLLGHKDTQTLRHYLQFDEKNMRLCPLSLTETDLLMEEGHYENL